VESEEAVDNKYVYRAPRKVTPATGGRGHIQPGGPHEEHRVFAQQHNC
jgi:hypothetical protein